MAATRESSEYGGDDGIIQPLPHELDPHENRFVQTSWSMRTAGQDPNLPETDLHHDIPAERWAEQPARTGNRLPTEQPPAKIG